MNTENNEDKKFNQVSVVYFHGMGNQRRYEELSRLVDALAKTSQDESESNDQAEKLIEIEPRIEKSRSVKNKRETYLRAYYKNEQNKDWKNVPKIKFYEVYWAPIMAKGSKPREVIVWMLSTVWRPFRTLLSPWRERQRLRRSILLKFREHKALWQDRYNDSDFTELLEAYDNFDTEEAIETYKKGRFEDFKQFISQSINKKPDKKKRLIALAERWKKTYRIQEIKNFFVLLTIALSLIVAFILSLALMIMFLQYLTDVGVIAYLNKKEFFDLAKGLAPSYSNTLPLILALSSLVGLKHFLSKYLGDVYQWTTYEETDVKHKNRKAVIERGVNTLIHVLKDKECDRVVVVGHSLGTTVAQDTLLSLTHINRAVDAGNPMSASIKLEKIEHFITMASPIDKVQYLFESFRSAYHRYRRVVDNLRGDVGTEPFAKNGKPHIHWINYWDKGDIVSGALYSVSNSEHVDLKVDNIEVKHFHFPEPASSHLAYFNHRGVMSDLLHIICRRAYSIVALKSIQGKGKDYDSVIVGPGHSSAITTFYLRLMMSVPYLVIANTVLRLFETSIMVKWIVGAPLLVVCTVLVVGFIYSFTKGHLEPLKDD